MDPITHLVTGALVGQIFAPDDPNRFAFALVCAGAGVVPDVDFVAKKAKSSMLFLKLHRGFTHSIVALPIIAACAGLAGNLLFGAPFWLLATASLAAAATHLMLDVVMHSTGLSLLWPMRRKISLHLVVGLNPLTSSARCGERSLGVCLRCSMHSAVINPFVLLLWAGFVASLVIPTWGLVSALVLAVAGTYLVYCQVMRGLARGVLGRSIGQDAGPGAEVYSGSFSPHRWVGVAPLPDGGWEVKLVHAVRGTVEPVGSHGPSAEGPEVQATLGTPTVEEFLNNAVTPHATLYRLGDQPLVIWRDLAFAYSPSVSLFAARVLLDGDNAVAAEEFRERWDRAPETGAVPAA